jgi:hypothetical protein
MFWIKKSRNARWVSLRSSLSWFLRSRLFLMASLSVFYALYTQSIKSRHCLSFARRQVATGWGVVMVFAGDKRAKTTPSPQLQAVASLPTSVSQAWHRWLHSLTASDIPVVKQSLFFNYNNLTTMLKKNTTHTNQKSKAKISWRTGMSSSSPKGFY